MEKIINAPPKERQRVFQTAAAELRIAPEMVEKDFWVCRILQKLFHDETLRKILRFKGGTSLSKVFHLIQRFSEDVDLILDWRCVTGENPLQQRSNTKQDIFNKSIQESSGKYISGELRAMVDAAMSGECSVVSDVNDDHVLLLQYPVSFRSSYIVPHIRLEIGPLAAWLPNQEFPVLPYVAEAFPQLSIMPVSVPTILAERTFWENSASGASSAGAFESSSALFPALLRLVYDGAIRMCRKCDERCLTPETGCRFQAEILSSGMGTL